MSITNWLDNLLIRFANYRAAKIPRHWIAFDESGSWDMGICNQQDAEDRITEGGRNKIKMIDNDAGFIFYE